MKGFGYHAMSSRAPVQRGLSLVELLIATALGLLLVVALTQLFSDVSRTNREMAKTNSQIESARFAMQFLRNDIVHAGFWSSFVPLFDDLMLGAVPTDVPQSVGTPPAAPSPCLPYSTWTPAFVDTLIGLPIMVYRTVPADCGTVITDHLADTDILVVRHAETCVADDANCDPFTAGRLYFQSSNNADEILDNNLRAIGTSTAVLNLRERNDTVVADRRRIIQHIYYIRSWANTAGDGIPALVRSEFDLRSGVLAQQPPIALVPGIERFRVQLGIDSLNKLGDTITLADYSNAVVWQDPNDRRVALNRGDGIPDGDFVVCPAAGCTVEQLINVVAVKVFLLARASEESPGYLDTKTYTLGDLVVPAFNDSFKRHVFGGTIRVNNVAARRETP
jgi:type IV pilus assembly protein PilW